VHNLGNFKEPRLGETGSHVKYERAGFYSLRSEKLRWEALKIAYQVALYAMI
jgi:hypothetical protein